MDCIYKNPNAHIEDRVKDLLSRMNLPEKIGQMIQIERSVASPSVLKDLSIGTLSLRHFFKQFLDNYENWQTLIGLFFCFSFGREYTECWRKQPI